MASRFIPSVLDSGISQVVRIRVSTDGESWSETAYMPITGNPTLVADRITVEVLP